jgi:uncharacterized membrane protein YgdD (TMEM256/DUF423 family)
MRLFLFPTFLVMSHMSVKLMVLSAGFFGFLSVALGAFAAHGLQGSIEDNLLRAFKTGVLYQMVHSLALLILAVLVLQLPSVKFWWSISGIAFVVGIFLFSGSLYGIALGGPKILGPVTPLGGLAFLTGWLAIIVGALKIH